MKEYLGELRGLENTDYMSLGRLRNERIPNCRSLGRLGERKNTKVIGLSGKPIVVGTRRSPCWVN